jgi:hypothetical protein
MSDRGQKFFGASRASVDPGLLTTPIRLAVSLESVELALDALMRFLGWSK